MPPLMQPTIALVLKILVQGLLYKPGVRDDIYTFHYEQIYEQRYPIGDFIPDPITKLLD